MDITVEMKGREGKEIRIRGLVGSSKDGHWGEAKTNPFIKRIITAEYRDWTVVEAYSGWEEGTGYYLVSPKVGIGEYTGGSPSSAGWQKYFDKPIKYQVCANDVGGSLGIYDDMYQAYKACAEAAASAWIVEGWEAQNCEGDDIFAERVINGRRVVYELVSRNPLKVMNFTPHEVHIIDESSVESRPDIRKLVSENPIITKTIPSSGMLNVKYELQDGEEIEGIRTRNKVRVGIDPIPDECDVAIVSGLYASATTDPRAYSIIDPVFDTEGKRVIGCLAIGKVLNE